MKKTNQQLDNRQIRHKQTITQNQNDEYDDHDEETLSSEGVGEREEGWWNQTNKIEVKAQWLEDKGKKEPSGVFSHTHELRT